MHFLQANVRYRQNVYNSSHIFYTKKYLSLKSMMPKCSGNFQKVSKKASLLELFWYKIYVLESRTILLKE